MSFFTFIAVPTAGLLLNYISSNSLKNGAYYLGLGISKYCKKVPYWDSYVEPILINASGKVFIAFHSLLEGMASDNEISLDTELKQFDSLVASQLTH